MQNNSQNNYIYKIYLSGFSIILLLPLLVIPPWFIPPDWGKTIIFRSIITLLLFLFAFQYLFLKNNFPKINIKKNVIIWALLALLFSYLLSTIFSQDVYFSLWGSPYRAGGFINFAFYITFAILLFLTIKESDQIKLANFSIFSGILVSIIALVQFYGLFDNIFIPVPGRPPSTIGNPILLGIYLLLLFFLTLTLSIKERKIPLKLFYSFSWLLFLIVIVISGSRAAYLGFFAGFFYFALFYPKKIIWPKIIVAILLTLTIFAVYIANLQEIPDFLKNNKISQQVISRLSLGILDDPRFSAWRVGLNAFKEKIFFGWGPENFAIGFDKNYDPLLPYINKDWGGWWDRAHNVFLETAVSAGFLGLASYIFLLIALFFTLSKIKNANNNINAKDGNPQNKLLAHSLMSSLVAYLFANFFSFDGFSSYILFFFMVSYSMQFTKKIDQENVFDKTNQKQNNAFKYFVVFLIIISITLFLWQYNFIPLQINAKIQEAGFLAENKKCKESFKKMDEILEKHSFLDAYLRMKYIEYIKICAESNPEKNLEFAKTGFELSKEAIKYRQSYPRLWIFLGSFTTIIAGAENDLKIKESLIKEANTYFEKAEQLAPKHQEILIEKAKADMVIGNYNSMKEKSEKCILLDPSLGECYWIKGMAEIYLKEFDQALSDIEIAEKKRFDTTSPLSMLKLATAYAKTENYKELSKIYLNLIKLNPSFPQYHSSLAFVYYKMKEYEKAKQEALKFLGLMPEAENEVKLFLKMIPNGF